MKKDAGAETAREEFHQILTELERSSDTSFALAALDDFLVALPPQVFPEALAERPDTQLSDFRWNYVAAMVEEAANRKGVSSPDWTADIPPLSQPYFRTEMISLRLHLLLSSPPPYASRNIFIDTGIGGRV